MKSAGGVSAQKTECTRAKECLGYHLKERGVVKWNVVFVVGGMCRKGGWYVHYAMRCLIR